MTWPKHINDAWFYTYAPNDPLSEKWQKGLVTIKQVNPDAVMIVGSDDLVTPKYIEACKYLISKGADLVYLPGCYFYCTKTKRMFWGWAERLGLGRCVSRSLLNRLDWKLWPDGLNSGLDGAMWDRINELKDVRIAKIDPPGS